MKCLSRLLNLILKKLNLNKEMNRFIQVGKFYPPHWGGIEEVTVQLQRILEDLDIETHVFCNSVLNINNLKTYKYIQIFRTPISIKFLNTFKKLKPNDTVVLHAPNPFIFFLAAILKKRAKYIVLWHAPARYNKFLEFHLNILYKLLQGKLDLIVAPTSNHFKTLPLAFKQIETKVIQFPISSQLRNVAKSRKNLRLTKEMVFITIGRLVGYKNHKLMIKAIKQIITKGFNAKLLIIGEGPDKSELVRLVNKLGLADYVSFLGSVSEEEKHELLNRSDIFLFPSASNKEMLGIAQIEAYSHGLPAIVSDIPNSGVGEIANRSCAAKLINPNCLDDLVKKMIIFYENSYLIEKMSKSAKNFIINEFNDDLIKQKWKEII